MVLHDTSHAVSQLKTSDEGQAGAWNHLQAIAARKEVQATYGPDVLQLKPVKWDGSVYLNNHKYHGPTAHAHLSSCLLPHNLCPSDFRRLCKPTNACPVKPSAEFTRGQATTGWNFSTCIDSVFQLASNNIPTTKEAKNSYFGYQVRHQCCC
ncbi:hypothetical protein WJX79_010010 [Trebouxia sp. C0005]